MTIPREQFLAHLAALDERYSVLENELANLAAKFDSSDYQNLSKELSGLTDIVRLFRTYKRIELDAKEAEQLVHAQGDPELREMGRSEAVSLRQQQADILRQLEDMWKQEQGEPERPLIIEIRAATGGLESSLFAGDLYRAYTKFAAKNSLSSELIDAHPTEAGGFKEIIFAIKGKGAYERFKFESGVHRVQRVPATEAQGRIHTSTVTVAVMPEPEEVELAAIPSKHLKIDVFRSTGAGGQSVNTTDSAVRITHLPSGLVVTCQDERSQLRNKEKAMRVLRARLLDQMQSSRQAQLASSRKEQVKGGERSEKIRTYNFPDRRVTDHRIGLTLHKLDLIMDGNFNELTDALLHNERSGSLSKTSK